MLIAFVLFFFFQAEDGIRDGHVTGVQTCALPIWPWSPMSQCTVNTSHDWSIARRTPPLGSFDPRVGGRASSFVEPGTAARPVGLTTRPLSPAPRPGLRPSAGRFLTAILHARSARESTRYGSDRIAWSARGTVTWNDPGSGRQPVLRVEG